MLNREDREFSSVLSTAKKALTLYSDPLVARNVSASDFSINDLVNFDNPVSLYIVVPPSDKVRLKPLLRLMFTMIVNRLTEKMDFVDGKQSRNKHRLLLMIDEFPTLGNMAVFADALAYMAGYGIKAYLIAQDMGQIIEHYTRNESIISNCHIRVAFAPNKIETAELLSKMTGTTTVQRAAMSFSGARSSTIMSQVSQNVEHVSRPLMTVDEVSRLPSAKKEGEGDAQRIVEPGAMLVFVAGSYPVLGTQILYFKDRELLRRSEFPMPNENYSIDHRGDIESKGILKLLPNKPPEKMLAIKTTVIADVTPPTTRTLTPAVGEVASPTTSSSSFIEVDFDLEEDQRRLAEMGSSETGSSGSTGHEVVAHDFGADEDEYDYNHDDEQNDHPADESDVDNLHDETTHGDDEQVQADHIRAATPTGAVYER
jgi:Type IV secretory system Conjugative DNA transfer